MTILKNKSAHNFRTCPSFERQRERGVVCIVSATQFPFWHKHEIKNEL
jgi:hypothetical protein